MRRFAFAVIAATLTACGNADSQPEPPADTLTQRQRDSIIGEWSLPGAGGVQRALEVTDSVNARRSVLEELQ